MSQELRIEAAARAAAKDEDASNWDDEPEYYRNGWCNRMAVGIEAADAALFSDEAIERAARVLEPTAWEPGAFWFCAHGQTLEEARAAFQSATIARVRAVVAALKGDA